MNYFKLLPACLLFAAGTTVVDAQVLVETESFEKRGGWVSDHQAFEKIGSAYIMAHGLGRPVADAQTTVEFPKAGSYHVYVSTYNWTSPWYKGEGPGAFKVVVDDRELPNKLGVTGDKWEWQYAGRVSVDNTAKVALRDLTGFNGRADAIYFSKEKTPPPADYKAMAGKRKELLGFGETQTESGFDLVVVGGGVAGSAMALTAARYGLNVCIIDNLPWLGGSRALGVRPSGLMHTNLYPELGNITCQVIGADVRDKNLESSYTINKNGSGEIKKFRSDLSKFPIRNAQESDILNMLERLSRDERKAISDREKRNIFNERDRRRASAVAEDYLTAAGVKIFSNVHVFAVEKDGENIRSVTGRSLKTGEDFKFEGRLFADCTGDGVLGYLAGAEFLIGRESKAYAGEVNAPDEPDMKMMGASMQWNAYPRANSGKFPKVTDMPWMMQCSDEYHIDAAQWAWWWETGLGINNAEEAELVRDNFLRAVFGNWAYLKNNVEKYKNHRLDYLHHIGMKRESRRIVGEMVLNENDILGQVEYPDASFTTTWTLDLHYAKPDNAKHFPGWEWITYCTNDPSIWIKPYHVPYRVLYSKDIPNLFLGGRNMSVTHQALGTVRVQATLGMAGEVAGMAAKICLDNNALPRDVYHTHLDKLKEYMKQGAPLE